MLQPKILLLGGGYTLSRLAALLEPESFVISTTNAVKLKDFEAKGYNSCLVDLLRPETLEQLFRHYPTLETIIDSVPPVFDRQIDPLSGSRNLMTALKGTKVKRFFYLSTTGVYGVQDGSVVDETTVARPNNPRAMARLETEALYKSSGLQFAAFRLPAIYGPGRGIVNSLRSGTYRLVGDGERWTNRIHVADLAQILRAACNRNELPQILCVADDCPAKSAELIKYYCSQFSLPVPEKISIEEASRAGLHTLTGNQRVSNSLMKRILELELRYPSYREGAVTEEQA